MLECWHGLTSNREIFIMTDSEYLKTYCPSATNDQIHDFTERVGIMCANGIDEETARKAAIAGICEDKN